jgi:P63C domain
VSDVAVGRAKGGFARAKKLSKDARIEIAKQGARARWKEDDASIPTASHTGILRIGSLEIPCAVLDDERRVITQLGFLRAIGRNRPAGGTSQGLAGEGLPTFLMPANLSPFISSDLRRASRPVVFRSPRGGGKGGTRAFGYLAELLPAVCNVYLDARRNNALLGQQRHIAEACELLLLGLAENGIIGLVDEATGYQYFRAKDALQEVLNAFLKKELAAWAKRFPDEFYQHIYRLRGWTKGSTNGSAGPRVIGSYTKDIVYARLAPGIIEELERRNPSEHGKRKSKHHQWLTEDVGHPALAQHLHAVVTLMRISKTWSQFMEFLDTAHPVRGDTLRLPLMLEPPQTTITVANANEPLPLFARLPDAAQV